MIASNGRSVMVQGRIVWTCGDLFKGKIKTEFNSQNPRKNAAGETMMEYGFGLAVPKSVLGQSGPGQPGEIWAAVHAEAMTLFQGGQIPPSFAMKFKDGDGIDHEGKQNNLKEGWAGHLVFACTTSLPIKYYRHENGGNVMVNEGIKCGDYVNVQLTVKAHAAHGQGKAGLYLNPNAVQFLGYGKEIVNAPTGDQVFGNAMPAMPQGASAVPVAPQAGQFAPMPPPTVAQGQQPGGSFAPVQYQQPVYQQPAAPAPQPHFGVVPQQFQPPPGGQPAYAPPPVQQPVYQQPGMPPMPPPYPQR